MAARVTAEDDSLASQLERVPDAVGGHPCGVGDGLPRLPGVPGGLNGCVAVVKGLSLAGYGFADAV